MKIVTARRGGGGRSEEDKGGGEQLCSVKSLEQGESGHQSSRAQEKGWIQTPFVGMTLQESL